MNTMRILHDFLCVVTFVCHDKDSLIGCLFINNAKSDANDSHQFEKEVVVSVVFHDTVSA